MPAVQYPFIDIAVHPRIRERFARGEAMALFSTGLDRVLWANGAGADLFGHPAIYDFIEQGPKQGDVSFRQVASTASQLATVGDTRSFLIRIAAGFQRVVVNATVELVRIQAGEEAVLFSCPVSSKALDTAESAQRMLEGFDDPDTHMAVIGRDGEIIASSTGFKALGITPQTASMLVTMAGLQPERMIKRPIPTGQGYLPAAIGRLSDSPALHLLFVVEMVIGHLDPVDNGVSTPAVESAIAAPLAPVESVDATALALTESIADETGPAFVEPVSAAPVADAIARHENAPEVTPAEEQPLAPTIDGGHAAPGDAFAAAEQISPAPEAESGTSESALNGMLDAIPAAGLPLEAAEVQDTTSPAETPLETQHAPETATPSVDDLSADTLDAIPAEHLPAEAAAVAEPAAAVATDHTDAHDLHENAAGFILPPSSIEEQPSEWATSYSLAELEGALPETTAEQEPQTATHHPDDDVSDVPAVLAADIAQHIDAHTEVAGELPASDIEGEPEHEAQAVEAEQHSPEDVAEPVASAGIADTATQESSAFTAMIDAVAEIEDVDDAPEDITEEAPAASREMDRAGSIDAEASTTHEADPVDGGAEAATHPIADTPPADETDEPVVEHDLGQVDHDAAVVDAVVETAAEETAKDPIEQTVPPSVEAETERAPEEPKATDETENPTEAEVDSDPAAEVEDADTGFVFNRNGRATRFVWKIDAAGRFSEISREFAEAVGPHATSVAGVAFTDIAALFNLDPDGKIAELLARRDTWSGRTIHWPVEGTTLTVPVDLAALPTYTRSREFDGFRGFGVVRLSDAAEDPMKIGLTLGRDAVAPEIAEAAASETEEAAATPLPAHETETEAGVASVSHEAEPVASHEIADLVDSEAASHVEEAPAAEADEPELPFNGEPPALRIVETPGRRLSDKIIQLHEHRLSISDSLSPSEQAAFREIAKQLEPFGKRGEPPIAQSGETSASRSESDDAVTAAHHHSAQEDGTDSIDDAFAPHVAANDDNKGAHELPPAEADGKTGEDLDPLTVLNTAIPPRSKMTDGLSAEVVDLLPVAVLVHAGDTLIHANPEFLRLTGYNDLSEVEAVGGLDALLQRHDLQGKTERPGTMVLVRADDVLVPVTARLQSIRWEDSSALMLALMPVEKDNDAEEAAPRSDGRDEARPERMLEKVAKLQVEVEELQSILETATDGVAIIGPEGDIRSMNRSASALFNYDEQETRGKPFVMLFAHESQKAVLDYLAGLTGNGVASVLNDGREVIGREASGGFVPLFMTMGVLTSSNGYCAVIRDITQWKRTEEELRNAKRAAETANAHKSDFLARVSHEIRTPLNAIIGFSDMMASERLGPIGHARYVEYAGDIGRSGRHVLDIVNDLLDISKIEAGEMELEFGSVGLNAAIAEAVSIVQPQANGQRVIIRTALAQSVPNVVADLRSIKQIALNILSNAIRFTPSGGQIVVSTSYEGNGSVVLRIRDTGVGMTRTELEQAMKPFRQVATNSRQRGDGTGLGLPLTKAMVDANRALFAIHSAPNEGTLVEVTFPSQRVLAN